MVPFSMEAWKLMAPANLPLWFMDADTLTKNCQPYIKLMDLVILGVV
jgi:hypothetical protein